MPLEQLSQDSSVQAEADRAKRAVPDFVTEAKGKSAVESFTVLYGRSGDVEHGVVMLRTAENNRALARLRIFTTTRELPLAGHPVIGTWFLLAELGVVPASEGSVHILQQTGAGILPVEFTFHNGRVVRVTMTQKPASFKRARFTRAALAETLGLKPSDLAASLPLEFVNTGISNLMVPVSRRSVLPRIHMNMRALARLISSGGTVAYCFALGGHGRVFAQPLAVGSAVGDGADAVFLAEITGVAINLHDHGDIPV